MRLRIAGTAVVGLLTACPTEGEAEDSATSSPTSVSSSSATTSDMTGSTGTPTEEESGDTPTPETESSADGSSSSGGACPEGREPAEVSEIDGCGEPLGEPYCSEGGVHVDVGTEIEWGSNPPHSGDHFPMWETWGEHTETVPRGNWVHNMEHGGIVLAYLCPNDSCPDELEVLRQVIEDRPDSRILMTSDPELPSEGFAAISWTWVHMFDEPDLDELLCFVDQHFNHAPEDVP